MINKALVYCPIAFISIILNFIAISIIEKNIFKYQTVLLFIIFCISILITFLHNYKQKLESFLFSCTLVLFLFIFNVFFPIFIDRSLSYHIVMLSNDAKITTQQLNNLNLIDKRIEELENLGLIKKSGDTISTTKFGIVFSKIMTGIWSKINKNSQYMQILNNVKRIQTN